MGFLHCSATSFTHAPRAAENRTDVDADERGGNQTENGKRGVSPANVFGRAERRAELSFLRKFFQRRPWIGDGDKVLPGLAFELLQFVPEVVEERIRLGGCARFARNQKKCMRQVDARLNGLNRRRMSAV